MHALPSLQGLALLANTQPVAVLQLSVVHGLESLQTTGVPAHAPPEQLSPVVQAFRSLHAFVLFAWTHPVPGSQLSLVHGLPSSQFSADPGRHVPNVHWSPDVHASPSSQASMLFENTQPVDVLQLSVVHKLASSQAIGVPTQAPPEQLSPVVHALPSEHALALLAWTHPVAVSQLSVVQTLPSSHSAFVVQVTGPAG